MGGDILVRCGGCGEQVNVKCRDHPSATVTTDSTSIYYNCDGGHMPHYAVCENPRGLPPHYLCDRIW